MTSLVQRPRPIEDEIRIRIQAEAVRRMQTLSEEAIAAKLDLLPIGVTALLRRKRWSLEEALRVAERLGMKVHVEVEAADDGG